MLQIYFNIYKWRIFWICSNIYIRMNKASLILWNACGLSIPSNKFPKMLYPPAIFAQIEIFYCQSNLRLWRFACCLSMVICILSNARKDYPSSLCLPNFLSMHQLAESNIRAFVELTLLRQFDIYQDSNYNRVPIRSELCWVY